MKKMTRLLSFLLCFALVCPSAANAELSDDSILLDPVQNTYTGRTQAMDLKTALSYDDVPVTSAQREAVVEGGALGIMRGESLTFFPNNTVSKAVALAALLKAVGLEDEALTEQQNLSASMETYWYSGYISLAAKMSLITPEELIDSQNDQALLDFETAFNLNAPATREDLARWLVLTYNYQRANTFTLPTTYQKLYMYEDAAQFRIATLPYIEIVATEGIIPPVENGTKFNPTGTVTRADLAQIIYNSEPYLLPVLGMERLSGTITAVKDSTIVQKNMEKLIRSYYIRTSTGKVDVIEYEMKSKTDPRPNEMDIPVYNNGTVNGIESLANGNKIEYIVQTKDKTAYYIKKVTDFNQSKKTVYLKSYDSEERAITVADSLSGNGTRTYTVAEGILFDTLPDGCIIELTLNSNLVVQVRYIGETTAIAEFYGVVTENDPDLGYLSMIDQSGVEVTKKYYSSELQVQKRPYYANEINDVGYIDKLFPGFHYNPNTTTIDQLAAGDIVYFRVDPTDSSVITDISAVTNYIVKYGKVRQIQKDGETAEIVLEYENKQTTVLSVPFDTFVSEGGAAKRVDGILAGDWIRVLVNEATIAPGYTVTTVIEIMLEGNEHFIEEILYGQLAGFDPIQKKMSVQNYQLLTKTGWSNYTSLVSLDLSGRDVAYYYGGKQISLDYAVSFLKRSDADVYIAMEKSYSGTRVKKVSFRLDRNEILEPDTIVDATGTGAFTMYGTMETLTADDGTIIRRYGRLVDKAAITASDYARVVQTAGNLATVIDIYDAPAFDGVQIVRGRIQSIDSGKSFQVQSMSSFNGLSWSYTPVERIFTIDYNTQFINSTGQISSSSFIGYGEASKIDAVYTIILDGQRAAKIIDTVYPTQAIRGTVYAQTANSVGIKDVSRYDANTGKWVSVGDTLAMQVTLNANTAIIVKNNTVISASQLEIGDQIRVMTLNLPDRFTNSTSIAGYMTFVEK